MVPLILHQAGPFLLSGFVTLYATARWHQKGPMT